MNAQEPRTLLFLSCDLVGSTQFKQQGGPWQRTFLSFYREFPQILGDLTREAEYGPGFTLWKAVGDELIFTTRVADENEIYRAVRIWIDAMGLYERTVLNDISMKTKGGAFTATFPGPDSESSIPKNPAMETSDKGVVELNDEALESRSIDYLFDFFGPSIDTGFRVLSACSNRYFTLSIEVVWAVAQCAVDARVGSTNHTVGDLRLLEAREFKGVWNGREYPLFAFDLHHADPVNVTLAKIGSAGLQPLDVVNLCRECAAKPDWPSKLYLPKSTHSDFKIEPVDSLDEFRSNSMDGAETVPDTGGDEALEADAPMGDEVVDVQH